MQLDMVIENHISKPQSPKRSSLSLSRILGESEQANGHIRRWLYEANN